MQKRTLWALAAAVALAAGAPSPGRGAVPAPFKSVDVGNPDPPGDTTVERTGPEAEWTITGTGSDIWGSADQFQFVYADLPGDGGITARLLSQTGGHSDGWARTGTMLRESLDPGSRCAFMPYTNGNAFQPSWRVETATTPTDDGLGSRGRRLNAGPIWIRTQRKGQIYQHLLSEDGKTWELIGQKTVPIDAGKPILAGLCATMHGGETPVVAIFDNVSVSADIVKPAPPGPTPVQAYPGTASVLLTYGNVANAVGYTIYRRETSQPADKAVKVNAQPTANAWFVDENLTNGTPLVYSVKAVYKNEAGETEEGRASTEVLVTPQEPVPPGFFLYYWTTTSPADVKLADNVLTIRASGADLGDVADSGAFLALPVVGDVTLTAKLIEKPVAEKPNTSSNVKAGIMLREGIAPSDRMAALFATSGRGILWEGRKNIQAAFGDNNGRFSQQGPPDEETVYPLWLQVTRAGSLLTAFQSNDGVNYIPVGDPQDYGRLLSTTYAGIAMSSGNATGYGTAKFAAPDGALKIDQ
jgi:hypothetical protein